MHTHGESTAQLRWQLPAPAKSFLLRTGPAVAALRVVAHLFGMQGRRALIIALCMHLALLWMPALPAARHADMGRLEAVDPDLDAAARDWRLSLRAAQPAAP